MVDGMMALPNISALPLEVPALDKLAPAIGLDHPPRILLLSGSLRERSFSRFLCNLLANCVVLTWVLQRGNILRKSEPPLSRLMRSRVPAVSLEGRRET